MFKDSEAPARRIEVFTGTGRRRAWDADEKARIVAESYTEGETVSAVARRHGLSSQQLFGWRRAMRVSIAEESRSPFVPAVVELASSEPKAVASEDPLVGFELEGASVWVCSGADAGMVAAIIHALKAGK